MNFRKENPLVEYLGFQQTVRVTDQFFDVSLVNVGINKTMGTKTDISLRHDVIKSDSSGTSKIFGVGEKLY